MKSFFTSKVLAAGAALLFSLTVAKAQNSFPATGNVGIGTSTPTTLLDLGNSITNRKIALYTSVNNDHQYFGFGINPNTLRLQIPATSSAYRFFRADGASASTEIFTIQGNGYVGIGITTPAQAFHVHNPGFSGTRVTTNVTGSTINDGVSFGYDDTYGAYVWNRENTAIIFSTNNTEKVRVDPNGNVGIGTKLTTNPNNYKLAVKGVIGAQAVKVETSSTTWADYVFLPTYQLRSLSEVESYIKANQHLPEVPSAEEVEKNGHNLGEMDATLLKKIEELTLYMIELEKQNKRLENELQSLRKAVQK